MTSSGGPFLWGGLSPRSGPRPLPLVQAQASRMPGGLLQGLLGSLCLLQKGHRLGCPFITVAGKVRGGKAGAAAAMLCLSRAASPLYLELPHKQPLESPSHR